MKKRTETKYIVIHTAAWPGDPSAEDIRRVHVEENGWSDIGYHYVIRKDGHIEPGRDEELQGAHCRAANMNQRSVGICCSGHGDQEPFTEEQRTALAALVSGLMMEYPIPIKNVIGHREAGANKTCPGEKVDMDLIRDFIYEYSTGRDVMDDLSTGEVTNSDLSPDNLQQASGAEPVDPVGPGPGRKKFWDTNFGQTIRAKNRWGKAIYTALGVGVTATTGINIGPVTDFITGTPTGIAPTITNIMELDIWNILIFVASTLLTLFIGRQALKGWMNDLAIELKEGLDKLSQARQPESPGGKTITAEEREELFKEAEDVFKILWRRLLRSRIARFFGLDPSLLQGDKSPEK